MKNNTYLDIREGDKIQLFNYEEHVINVAYASLNDIQGTVVYCASGNAYHRNTLKNAVKDGLIRIIRPIKVKGENQWIYTKF